MDEYCLMVEASRLLQQVDSLALPKIEVLKNIIKLFLDLSPWNSEIQISSPKLSRPLPNVPIHILVQLFRRDQIKRGDLACEIAPEILGQAIKDVSSFADR